MKERTTVQTSLLGIAKKARAEKRYRFRNLYRELNEEMLHDSWRLIRKDAAYGVDRVSAAEYEANLEENIHRLVEKLKRKSYRAKLVRRQYIPKGDGGMRPLGIPAIEDKLLQLAVKRLLEAIYEQDFLSCSYGYRPRVGALTAVDQLTVKLQFGNYHYVVEADIKGFFDNISHEWLMRMLAERIDDARDTTLDQEVVESRSAGYRWTSAEAGRWHAAGRHHLSNLSQCVPALRARFVVRESVPAQQ